MEATETAPNGKAAKNNIVSAGKTTTKRQRRARPAPAAYSAQQLKEVTFSLPKVAQQGIAFQSEFLKIYSTFSLTADGESVCIKKSKSEAVRLSDGHLFDGANLTVYQLVW
jgi:hypothetical protein